MVLVHALWLFVSLCYKQKCSLGKTMAMAWFWEMQYIDVCWSHEMFRFSGIIKVVMTAMTATTVSFYFLMVAECQTQTFCFDEWLVLFFLCDMCVCLW